MTTLRYTKLFGTLGIAAGFMLQKMLSAIINSHGINSVLYALPFG